MLPKHAVVFDPDDVIGVLRIVISQMLQYFQLHLGLVLKPLFISNNFHSHDFACLVVHAPQSLPETTLA